MIDVDDRELLGRAGETLATESERVCGALESCRKEARRIGRVELADSISQSIYRLSVAVRLWRSCAKAVESN